MIELWASGQVAVRDASNGWRRAAALSMLMCISSVLAINPASANDADTCRLLAGSLTEPDAGGRGVSFFRLDRSAIDICKRAWDADNSDHATAYRYARVLTATGQFAMARTVVKPAADAGYLPAVDLSAFYMLSHSTSFHERLAALPLLRRAAEQGSADAKARLALLHVSGNPVFEKDAAAFAYMKEAAEKQVVQAQTGLGMMLLDGRGTKKNIKAGLEWLHRADENGDPAALVTLGTMSALGQHVPKDPELARRIFERGYSRDLPDATYNIGLLHEKGIGVRQDRRTAYGFYKEAADRHDHAPSLLKLARLNIEQGDWEVAKVRLDRIVSKGDPGSRAEAEELLRIHESRQNRSGSGGGGSSAETAAVVGGLILFVLAVAVLSSPDRGGTGTKAFEPPDPCAPFAASARFNEEARRIHILSGCSAW